MPAGEKEFFKEAQATSAIFTVCSANYITKALAMCQSVLEHNDDIDLFITVLDRKRDLKFHHPNINIIWVEDTDYPDYYQCAFKYNIIELNTAVKPFIALMLNERYPKVIYLDPDILVFSSLNPIFEDLDQSSVILSPHALTPYDGIGRPDDIDLLRFGSFNLGFFAAKASDDSRALLLWWHKRCYSSCFYEPSQGLGVDQKWIDLAPCFFQDVSISKHPGINVAFWNLHERTISCEKERWQVNGKFPLIFVHFSSFDEEDPLAVARKQTRYLPGSRPDFTLARNAYADALEKAKALIDTFDTSYGYATMADGSTITDSLRRFYAVQLDKDFKKIADPFAVPGPVYNFAKRNRLLEKGKTHRAHINFNDDQRFENKKRVINLGFKFALRLLGPVRYAMLMRYLGSHASILKQADLIK